MSGPSAPCDLCGVEGRGRRHWLVGGFANGHATYGCLCTQCYRLALWDMANGRPAPRWYGPELSRPINGPFMDLRSSPDDGEEPVKGPEGRA